MKKIVFLDLEYTVIDEFWRAGGASLMNIERVRAFLAVERPDCVRLFSFAMADGDTVERFRREFEVRLSQALGVAFDLHDTFTTEKLFRLCRRHGTFFEDDNECMLFHGKEIGFQRFIEMSGQFDDTEVVLVDDSVELKEIRLPRRNLTIRMLNVNDLPH
jgi:pimeloyl-CoA synthetase